MVKIDILFKSNLAHCEGTLKKILVKYRPPTQFCPDYSGKPLGFSSVFTAFGILFFGVGITSIIFAIEKISKILRLECCIFSNYGVLEENFKYSGSKRMKCISAKDEENST